MDTTCVSLTAASAQTNNQDQSLQIMLTPLLRIRSVNGCFYLRQKSMSARRAKQDLKAGVQQLENMWDSLAEKHLSECILLRMCVQEDQHSHDSSWNTEYSI